MLRQRSHLFLALAVALDAVLGGASWMACYVVRFRLGLLRYMEATPPSAALFVSRVIFHKVLLALRRRGC